MDLEECFKLFEIKHDIDRLLQSNIPFEIYKKEFYKIIDTAKKRFKELSRKHHPDLTGDDEMMKKISNAKSLLDKLEPCQRKQIPQPPPVQVVIISTGGGFGGGFGGSASTTGTDAGWSWY